VERKQLVHAAYINPFPRDSVNGDCQVLAGFWRVGGDCNGLNADGIKVGALKKWECDVRAIYMLQLYERLTTIFPAPTFGGVDRTILISDWLLLRRKQ